MRSSIEGKNESDYEQDQIDDSILTMRARRMLENFNEWTQDDY